MRYTGIQPQYFPRLHYFARILNTDTFVIRDDAQFVAKHKYPDGKIGKSYQVHTPIKSGAGLLLLTVPVSHQGYQSLVDVKVNYDHDWRDNHLKTIQFAYRKATHFEELYPQLEQLLEHSYKSVAELNIATILWGLQRLMGIPFNGVEGLKTEIIQKQLLDAKLFQLSKIEKASQLAEKGQFSHLLKNEKILALLRAVGATEDYCGGTAHQAYMDEDMFKKNGIKIVLQDWACPEYPQLFSKQYSFIPNLSIVDLLMNTTVQEARGILYPKIG